MPEKLLPYFEERSAPVELLVFHCNAFDLEQFCHWMHEYKTSAHYFIAEDGEITRLVPEDKCAYHAGKGFWRGKTAINARSIGIELQNQTLGQTPYAPRQISALITLSQEIARRYDIRPENIIGHSDSAPTRKPDPGICFPWQELAQQGLGIWPAPTSDNTRHNQSALPIAALLARIGYMTETSEQTQASACAFCRHFESQFITPDFDIPHLIDHVLPDNFDFMQNPQFLKMLRCVAEAYPALT